MIFICDAVSKLNGGARKYCLKYNYLPIKFIIKYKHQYQILLSVSEKENNKLDIYQAHFQIKLSILLMNQ